MNTGSITELRKYRINLETKDIFNNQSNGMAIFDTILSFVGAYIIIKLFKIKNTKLVFVSVIPLGILFHHIAAHIMQMKLIPTEITYLNSKIISTEMNKYKLILAVNLVLVLIYLK